MEHNKLFFLVNFTHSNGENSKVAGGGEYSTSYGHGSVACCVLIQSDSGGARPRNLAGHLRGNTYVFFLGGR